jgi:hypothetical protein
VTAPFEQFVAGLFGCLEQSQDTLEAMVRLLGAPQDDVAPGGAGERGRPRTSTRARRSAYQEDGMAKTAKDRISKLAKAALLKATVEDDAITVPEAVTSTVRQEMDAVLQALGGRWYHTRQAYVFAGPLGLDLADRYYEVVTAGAWVDDVTGFAFPSWLARHMVEVVDVQGTHRVMEASSGETSLVPAILARVEAPEQIVTCPTPEGLLSYPAGTPFDRVVLRPPKTGGAGFDHVRRAMALTKPGGRLVSVLSAGIVGRQDRAHRDLHQEFLRHGSIVAIPERMLGGVPGVRPVLAVWTCPPPIEQPQPQEQARAGAPVAVAGADGPVVTSGPPARFRRALRP